MIYAWPPILLKARFWYLCCLYNTPNSAVKNTKRSLRRYTVSLSALCTDASKTIAFNDPSVKVLRKYAGSYVMQEMQWLMKDFSSVLLTDWLQFACHCLGSQGPSWTWGDAYSLLSASSSSSSSSKPGGQIENGKKLKTPCHRSASGCCYGLSPRPVSRAYQAFFSSPGGTLRLLGNTEKSVFFSSSPPGYGTDGGQCCKMRSNL